jgi:hypothetical protein
MSSSDVKTAFLAAPVGESQIWIRFPEGLKYYDDEGVELYGHLNRSLYGISQAPLNFYRHLSAILLKLGFVMHLMDECMFTLESKLGGMVVNIFVDDILYGSSCVEVKRWFQESLSKHYDMKHFEEVDAFIGIGINHLSPHHIELNMSRHIIGGLDTFDIKLKASIKTPMDYNITTTRHEGEASNVEVSKYRSMIGTLMYIATGGRPDIAFATSLCSQFMLNPSAEHFVMVNRIFQYLGNCVHKALVYKQCVGQPFYMFAMVDASYGSVTEEARSHTGFMLWSNVGLIHYKSVAQKTLATSASSAEMRAAFHCGKDVLSIRALLREVAVGLGRFGNFSQLASLILVDNSATVQLTRTPRNTEKSRHWLMAMRWMRQFQELGHLRFAWIAGKDNLSDLLTKPVVPSIWAFWSPYFFLADWLQKYVSEMVMDQLGVKVESWVPSVTVTELSVDASMEDVLGGVQTNELELPGMETVISGGGRVDTAQIWPGMQQASLLTTSEVLDMFQELHSVGGCLLFGLTGQRSTPSLECAALDASRVQLLRLRVTDIAGSNAS